eukprot:CAMPEP_0176154810 /NCGR_PEP_ID=MMETSP0120_2-20121206/79092_1 /TAXON_ID=160619 /ORGANISM="Kryptoperidinium foliaceum, Strain CCMP 1326" /LENGTH=148 /DNA_ID=CAMNT_0017491917 /DNA_START=1 /DNA_END=444 /DNA_ORIENTATION=+
MKRSLSHCSFLVLLAAGACQIHRSSGFQMPVSGLAGRMSPGNRKISDPRSTRIQAADDTKPDVRFSREIAETTIDLDKESNKDQTAESMAATNTVNERLMAELQAAEKKEKFGARSTAGKKMGLVDGYGRPRKTDEEIQAAIEAARDL